MMNISHSTLALLLVVSAISADTSTALNNLRTRKLQTYSSYDDYYQQMLDAVNAERSKAGLSALCTNKKLAAAAKRHSDDMAANDFMAHDGSDGSTMSQRVTDAGYEWSAVAENVAAGQEDVASVMESWMNSEGHRANILGADYTMFGTAYAYDESTTYKHYWTQDFGAGDTEACDS
ncbi:SCP-like extracellular protein, partial [Phytophthora palmivora]